MRGGKGPVDRTRRVGAHNQIRYTRRPDVWLQIYRTLTALAGGEGSSVFGGRTPPSLGVTLEEAEQPVVHPTALHGGPRSSPPCRRASARGIGFRVRWGGPNGLA